MKKIFFLIGYLSTFTAFSQTLTNQQYRTDFDYFWNTINDNYAYFQKKGIDWNSLRPVYQAQVDTVSTRNGFVRILEKAINELYDHHCSLNTNTPASSRLIPTGTDLWASYHDGKPVIDEVRIGMGADKVGIQAGMEIMAINDLEVAKAILPYLAHTRTAEAWNFALRLALAGNHIDKRKITVKTISGTRDFFPDQDGLLLEHIEYPAMVQSKTSHEIDYIKINNFLYDNQLIPRFDSVLNASLEKKALIIDLRETPSGGNTSVARAILGRFISKEQCYQKHELYAEERETGIKRSWVEIVSPRGVTYNGKVVILANHWTGSISEGITIAFDGMKRATVIGTELARLNGAVESFRMPGTKIGFNISTERLYHINGTARECYQPAIKVSMANQHPGDDPILAKAIDFLKAKKDF
ncbi:S41 family peptidase [Pedobacter sp. JY14-1]|uniref:S41 family peptidase n=1 Tax=Pedobacter sp. JY14-1 TaxID=3034151 RepID=UPI0023E0B6B3|nr:S41 family peptidase [Pedobacter sp. JY14-1]